MGPTTIKSYLHSYNSAFRGPRPPKHFGKQLRNPPDRNSKVSEDYSLNIDAPAGRLPHDPSVDFPGIASDEIIRWFLFLVVVDPKALNTISSLLTTAIQPQFPGALSCLLAMALWNLVLVTLALTESALAKDSFRIPSRLWYNAAAPDVCCPFPHLQGNTEQIFPIVGQSSALWKWPSRWHVLRDSFERAC